MSTRHSDTDGSDIFWPGYVDAVSNLVLSLLFLLTVMTVAVFMFALELGRASQGGAGKELVTATRKDASAVPVATMDPAKENIALKLEIQRLNKLLAQKEPHTVIPAQAGDQVKTVDVTSVAPKPLNGLDKSLASEAEIIVRFTEEAVAFTPAEHDRLRESLKPVIAAGRTTVYVEVPAGFSEAKRMGYYRAMAVRNLLIEMNMPKERIDVAVREGKSSANASIVRVRPR
jgi:ribosomal protein L25 (general stress protein Ctc)